MHTYKVTVTRDDRWWMVTVPELNGYVAPGGAINMSDTTQARRLSVTDSAPSEVGIDVTVNVDGVDVTARVAEAAAHRELAERYAATAAAEARDLARDLAARGVPVRDVGEALGMSFQRAQQLIAS